MAKFSKVTTKQRMDDGTEEIVGERKPYSPQAMKQIVGTIAQRSFEHDHRELLPAKYEKKSTELG